MGETTLQRYEATVRSGALDRDPAQAQVIERLNALDLALRDRSRSKSGALSWLFARKKEPVKGLYVWGEVGRGKTRLMDMFFEAAAVPKKRRAHFHDFMIDVHARLHEARQAAKVGKAPTGDLIPGVADQIAAEAGLLCFDEMHVTDIADAMILSRLFQRLFEAGVTVVATSNVPPMELYKDGLNRALFLPFIDLVRQRMEVVKLESRTDFRREKLGDNGLWHAPADAGAEAALDAAFTALAGGPGAPATLDVQGRHIPLPRAANGVARASFDDLCGRPLGAGDYIALARRYHTLVLDRVPVLDDQRRNEARRFMTLVDELYEHGVKLVASAEAEPDQLWAGSEGYEAFGFARTASRLAEMGSEEWLSRPHGRPDSAASGATTGLVET
ncbi:cell division protein ZapE [Methylopila jiangsuensis]|uniref:Cell division protein ZapE n=1 Tax=Methylopila jiangsuensis TaxID=586230 RepID=A0A9W6JD02_9HYPH|nr:cell division protein ZapE [Methylopila jiangsuensis]MDR6287496.1 cell division protein ZapE [Methylopila jiangsuensis]GLK74752.1 cell division protein ZapE [Methylopila jiangsuensis]